MKPESHEESSITRTKEIRMKIASIVGTTVLVLVVAAAARPAAQPV